MSMRINHDTIYSSGNHNLSHEEFWVYGFCITFLLGKTKVVIQNKNLNPYLSFSFPSDLGSRIEYTIYWLLLFLFQNIKCFSFLDILNSEQCFNCFEAFTFDAFMSDSLSLEVIPVVPKRQKLNCKHLVLRLSALFMCSWAAPWTRNRNKYFFKCLALD